MSRRTHGRVPSLTVAAVLAATLLIALVFALSLGAATVWPTQWFSGTEAQAELVRVWRAPRVAAAFFVGACLALAGLVFQGLFRNPLAEPYLLGSASGAAVLPSDWSLPILAFLGAWGASWLVLLIGRLQSDGSTAGSSSATAAPTAAPLALPSR
ncbi:MAG: hypothetical protein EOO24_28280 [Comamonadaceae bacterium]|nr:MAG: hypothetical protein EOO24_28280 [Comamonadaceae bacterium]